MNIIQLMHSSEGDQLHGIVSDRDIQPGTFMLSVGRAAITLTKAGNGEKVAAVCRGTVSLLAANFDIPPGYKGEVYAPATFYMHPEYGFPVQNILPDGTLLLANPSLDYFTPDLYGQPPVLVGVVDDWDFSNPHFPRFTLCLGSPKHMYPDSVARQMAIDAASAANKMPSFLSLPYNFTVAPGAYRKLSFSTVNTSGGVVVDMPEGDYPASPAEVKSGFALDSKGMYLLTFAPRYNAAFSPYTFTVKAGNSNMIFIGGMDQAPVAAANEWPKSCVLYLPSSNPPPAGDPLQNVIYFVIHNTGAVPLVFGEGVVITLIKVANTPF